MTPSNNAAHAPVKIVQLYPAELAVSGDIGNARVLQRRFERSGIPAERVSVGRGETLPSDADIVVFGDGPLSAMRIVHEDFLARRGSIQQLLDQGVPMLAIGAGAELLSAGIDLLDAEGTVEGLGILPMRVERTRDRRVGYIVAESAGGVLIGFEDHASEWQLDKGVTTLATVIGGKGSYPLGDGRGEGIRHGSLFALNIQGPFLPLNPQFADMLLTLVAERRGLSFTPGEGVASVNTLADGARTTIEKLIAHTHVTYMKV